MARTLAYTEADSAFRHALYQFIVTRGHIPKIRELAAELALSRTTVRSGLQRLAELHVLVLQQHTSEILRAAPFWAVPTAFHVQSGRHAWWASCIWDALGIPAMLGQKAMITTGCGCCDSAMALSARKGRLLRAKGVIHFAVPASRWYENVVFT
jgi:DNA-binding transcriptional MocR family regulator